MKAEGDSKGRHELSKDDYITGYKQGVRDTLREELGLAAAEQYLEDFSEYTNRWAEIRADEYCDKN